MSLVKWREVPFVDLRNHVLMGTMWPGENVGHCDVDCANTRSHTSLPIGTYRPLFGHHRTIIQHSNLGEHQQPQTDVTVCRLITFQASRFFQVCNDNNVGTTTVNMSFRSHSQLVTNGNVICINITNPSHAHTV